MLNLLPKVKTLKINDGFLKKRTIFFDVSKLDERLVIALEKISFDENGAELIVEAGDAASESYELFIEENAIKIKSASPNGAFYAIQTLRQIFMHEEIPCLYIKDEPDMKYRGFYHDVTRGKIPTVETIKSLIDNMAFFKLNSLQLSTPN